MFSSIDQNTFQYTERICGYLLFIGVMIILCVESINGVKFWHTHLAQKRNMVEILQQCIHVTRGSWLEIQYVLKLTLTCFSERENYLDSNYR